MRVHILLIFFELNYGYHPCGILKNEVDPCSQSYSTNELAKKLMKLILLY